MYKDMYKYPINQIYFCFYFFKIGGNGLAMVRAAFENANFSTYKYINYGAECSCLQLIAACTMSLCYHPVLFLFLLFQLSQFGFEVNFFLQFPKSFHSQFRNIHAQLDS